MQIQIDPGPFDQRNILRTDTTDKARASLRRKRAAWDDEIRMNMLGLKPL